MAAVNCVYSFCSKSGHVPGAALAKGCVSLEGIHSGQPGFHLGQALEIIRGCQGLNVVGCDLVEVSPQYDVSGK